MGAERVGTVQTVRGLIAPEQMGIALMHEHLLIDYRCRFGAADEARDGFARAPVGLENRADLLQDPFGNLDNLVLDDEAEAIEAAGAFREAGGGTIVDCTTLGLGRNPAALRRISEATGLHISLGAGFYSGLAHPAEMDAWSEEEICARIVREVDEGVDGTGIRCGHIGEIGAERLTPNEMKVVRAAARAQALTGALLTIHQIYALTGRSGHALADAIEAAGGDLRRTIFCHMDETNEDAEYQESLLKRGITIEYDLFGWEFYLAPYDVQFPQDAARVRGIARLLEAGWGRQVVLSHDLCMKMMRTRYGGWGYAHLLTRVVPRLRRAGVSEAELRMLLVENPRRLLAFAAPRG